MTAAQQLRCFDLLGRAAEMLRDRAEVRGLLRAGEGNPNHKPAGPGGGQFTSGGGSGHGAAHGKHWARRQRRKKRLEKLRKGFHADAKELKARHKGERAEMKKDQAKARADQRKGHARDRKDHLKWEAGERKSLAKEHAREHAANDRQHAKALAKHEKDAPKRHAAIDKAHGEKAQRIARGERAARRIDERHAAEREAHAKSLEGLESANERMYAAEREAHRKREASDEEHAALEKRIADHKAKVKEQPEKQRAEMAARHAREKEKAETFLAKSGSLKERLEKQTAAKHREVDRTPKRLAKQHAGAKSRLEAEHAEAREAQANEHKEARADVRKDQRDDRASLREDHREEREGLKDTHREERDEFREGWRQELADHGFRRKGAKGGDAGERSGESRGIHPPDAGSRGLFSGLGINGRSDGEDSPGGRIDRRFHPGRTAKASSAESILRLCLRSRGWSAQWRRGELTGEESLELLGDIRQYGMAWLHHEAEGLFRAHGRRDEDRASPGDAALVRSWGLPGASQPGSIIAEESADGDTVSRALTGTARSHVSRFFRRAKQFCHELILAGAMALAGPSGLTADEIADADHAAQVQAEFFDRFQAEVIASPPVELAPPAVGPIPPTPGVFVLPTVEPSGAALKEPMTAKEFAARAEMYGNTGNTAPHEINRRAVIRSGQAVAERRIHGFPVDDMCSICRGAVAKGWSPLGSLPAIGDSECLTACHCHFEFKRADGSVFILAREAKRAA